MHLILFAFLFFLLYLPFLGDRSELGGYLFDELLEKVVRDVYLDLSLLVLVVKPPLLLRFDLLCQQLSQPLLSLDSECLL